MLNCTQIINAAKKAVQAAVIWVIVFGCIALVQPDALHVPQLWMLCSVGILANIFQPSYNPFEKSRTAEDRGTAVQILWTVYGVQISAVAEFLLKHERPELGIGTVIIMAYILGGLALRTWAVVLLGRWFTWNVDVQENQQVVESGPYALIRHPSYTGAFIMFTGATLLLNAYISFLIAVIALTIAFRRRIKHEELLLVTSLPAYAAYIKRTGAMFPRL